MRSLFQSHLQTLGLYIQKNAGKILFVAIIVLSAFCVGLKSATIHSKVQQLWIQGKLIVDQMLDVICLAVRHRYRQELNLNRRF